MNIYGKKWLNNRGMTLIEILIAVFILSIGMMGTLSYFTTTQIALRMAREKTTATLHAEYILEDMRTKTTLAEITSNDWPAFVTSEGLDTLDGENIQVAFVDVDADPLEISVTVGWNSGSRSSSISLQTEMTK